MVETPTLGIEEMHRGRVQCDRKAITDRDAGRAMCLDRKTLPVHQLNLDQVLISQVFD
jgi:hypothetical protein